MKSTKRVALSTLLASSFACGGAASDALPEPTVERIRPEGEGLRSFGSVIATFGDRIAISAPSYGLVQVWRTAGSAPALEVELRQDGRLGEGVFGTALAMSDDTLVVMADRATPANRGASYVRVYRRTGSAWQMSAEWATGAEGSARGAVAIRGEWIAVGHPDLEQGSITLHAAGDPLGSQTRTIVSPFLDGRGFGASIAMYEDGLAVGAPGAGSIVIFDANDEVTQILEAFEDTNLRGLGGSVVATQDILVAGASGTILPGAEPGSTHYGAALVFERRPFGWFQTARLMAPNPGREDELGSALAIDDERILIGVPGRARGFNKVGSAFIATRAGNTWELSEEIESPTAEAGARAGEAVAFVEGAPVLGSPGIGTALLFR